MENRHVTYDREKQQWTVKKPNSSRTVSYHDTQKEAEKAAKTIVANQGGGEVRIHRKDNGKIRDSDTVAPGNDPRSSKDTKF